jgi:RNA polymerase sigma factor (sigma-70 family)
VAARLFELYAERIHAFCRHVLRNPSDAEDAVQTTFLHAHRAIDRGVLPENEYAWLHTIAKNVCRSQFRSAARHPAVGGLDLEALPAPDGVEDGRQELLAVLPRALAALSENQRNALVMREWQGLGHEEIARRLDLTTTATSALLTRARHSLAAALTAAGRPRSALDVSVLLGALRMHLRSLLGGAASKAAVGATVATVAVGGVVVEQSLESGSSKREPGSPSVAMTDPARLVQAPTATRVPQVDPARQARPRRALHPTSNVESAAVPVSSAPGGPVTWASVPPTSGGPPRESSRASSDPPTPAPERNDPAAQSPLPEVPDPGVALPVPAIELPPLVPLPPLPPAPDPSSDLPVDVPPTPPLPPLP